VKKNSITITVDKIPNDNGKKNWKAWTRINGVVYEGIGPGIMTAVKALWPKIVTAAKLVTSNVETSKKTKDHN
jgi:hypothetical protein